jgi:hypothetical protein
MKSNVNNFYQNFHLKDKDVQNKNKSTPLHYFIQTNIISKHKYIHETKGGIEKTNFEKQISVN